MILLGGFSTDKVSDARIETASRALKQYATMLVNYGIPCRYTSHQIIHLPQDVNKFGCGVECLSAFPFELLLFFSAKCMIWKFGTRTLEKQTR